MLCCVTIGTVCQGVKNLDSNLEGLMNACLTCITIFMFLSDDNISSPRMDVCTGEVSSTSML